MVMVGSLLLLFQCNPTPYSTPGLVSRVRDPLKQSKSLPEPIIRFLPLTETSCQNLGYPHLHLRLSYKFHAITDPLDLLTGAQLGRRPPDHQRSSSFSQSFSNCRYPPC